jgi:hypothetical protein
MAEKIAWFLFCLTCFYMASLEPYVVLVPGERGNVFAGFMCAVTLSVAVLVCGKRAARMTYTEILISVGLLALGAVSGLASATPWSSSIRVLVVMSTGLGGFWCARIMLSSPNRFRAFAWLCTLAVSGIVFLSLWGYHLYGRVDYYLFQNSHQIIQMAILLLVGPLTMIGTFKPFKTLLGIVLTCLCCAVLFLAAVQSQISGVLVPLGAVIFIGLLAIFRAKSWAGQFLLLLAAAAMAAYFFSYFNQKSTSGVEFQAYRFESYPFSWHVIKKHPLLGVGLRTPRDDLLDDYEIRHPAYPRERFARQLHTLVTPENAYLALLTGLGAPFFLLYALAVIWLLSWLIRDFYRPPPDDGQGVRAWALLVPVLGSMLHALTTDTSMLPQVSWYFHLLLGLVPRPEPAIAPARERASWESVAVRTVALLGALALGIFLGTHPYFSPEKLPSADAVHAFLKQVPIVKLLYYEKKLASLPGEKPGSGHLGRPGPGDREFERGPGLSDIYGTLVVNIEGYKGIPVKWALLVILDNSKTMNEEFGKAGQTRRDVALDVTLSLAKALPSGSQMAVRAFTSEAVARKKSKEIPLRLSKLVLDWTEDPASKLPHVLQAISFRDSDNLCAALSRSLQKDFAGISDATRRIVLVSDGQKECSFQEALRLLAKEKAREDVVVDVVAIDMPGPARGSYAKLTADTGGTLVKLASPEGLREKVSRYCASLELYRQLPLEVMSGHARRSIQAGEGFRFSPGSYTVELPEIEGGATGKRLIKNVKIETGKTTVLNISARGEEVLIQ